MAHVQKIKQGAVAPLVAHYERVAELERGFTRGNIDPERTELNYNLRPHDVRQEVKLAIAQHEETSGKGIRKDANVLCDWVVTLPQDCPRDRSRDFFESVVQFMEGRYGKGNVLGCYVHMDETTPHAHIPILPMRDGKLVASKVVNRADLKSFHGNLGKAVDKALGVHVSIELDEEQKGEKQLSHLSQDEYVAAKKRLECLRREESRAVEEIRELEPAAQTVAESARTLYKARSDGGREEVLAGEVESLRSRIGELEDANQRARDRMAELDRELPRLRGRNQKLEQRFRVVERRVTAAVERLREVPETLGEWALDIARRLGKRIYDPRSPDRMAADAIAVAREMSRARGWDDQSRRRGQER